MTEDDKFLLNTKIQEYCQYWVPILGLQRWIIAAALVDSSKTEMEYDLMTGTASIRLASPEQWSQQYPNLQYDIESVLVANLLRLSLEHKKQSLAINYLARVLIQFRKTINPST